MGRIQSSVGLITGVPIQDTVAQLMQLASRPRDLLQSRSQALQQQQVALAELMARVISVQAAADRLGKVELFQRQQVTSSHPDALSVSSTGTAPLGSFSFTPVRRAQSHQLLTSGVSAADAPLGGGRFTLQFGGFVDSSARLDQLNGGQGVERGKIRITDRSGASELIDLSLAVTIDDVLQAINSASTVQVSARAEGDAIRLVDLTGQSAANLRVQDVGLGRTATDLGLAAINVASDQALGQDVLRLHRQLNLNQLHDAAGVGVRQGLADLDITFADGSSLTVDFHRPASGPANATATTDPANGADAQLTFTAVEPGEEYDGVTIAFVDDPGVTQGNETVTWDASDPDNKTLTFQIAGGQTTASDLVAALAADGTASQLFTAQAGGDGTGVVDVGDSAVTSGGAAQDPLQERTLGDLLDTLNAADPARLLARIHADGDRLELVDLTGGSGTFTVASHAGGTLAEDLGLAGSTSGDTLAGRRLLGGLKTTLLGTLNGGQGFGSLGILDITDRSGASASVDLQSAVTLEDVLAAINAANVAVTARVNPARNGIQLLDTSGGSGQLIVASGDGTEAAEKLNLAFAGLESQVDGGSLHRQTVSRHTPLSEMNFGQGVAPGSFLITDSQGTISAANLVTANAKTLGDVIDLINSLSVNVQAKINDTGDGIAVVDLAGGSGQLRITDSGNGSAAKQLGIAGESVEELVDGTPTKRLQGRATVVVQLEQHETLQDLAERIEQLNIPVRASVMNDGSSVAPFRLSLVSQIPGSAGEMLVDASDLGLGLQQMARARDALLQVGGGEAGILVSSSSNQFTDLVAGVTLTVHGPSTAPVTVNVEPNRDTIVNGVKLFVDEFNKLRERLQQYNFFNEEESSTGILFGTNEALRLDTDFNRVLSGRFAGAGPLGSSESLGIRFEEDGQLTLDEDRLRQRLQSDAGAVEQFFTQEVTGFAAQIHRVAEQLAGEDHSLLINSTQRNQRTLEMYQDRIERMNLRLDRQRERLLRDFFNLESAIAKLQNNLVALDALQPVPPITSSGRL